MVERMVDWEVSHSCGGKRGEVVEGEMCRSLARRSRSDRERSSMKFIRFAIFKFLVGGVGELDFGVSLEFDSIFVSVLISVRLVGLDIEECWYRNGWMHFGVDIGFKRWVIHNLQSIGGCSVFWKR